MAIPHIWVVSLVLAKDALSSWLVLADYACSWLPPPFFSKVSYPRAKMVFKERWTHDSMTSGFLSRRGQATNKHYDSKVDCWNLAAPRWQGSLGTAFCWRFCLLRAVCLVRPLTYSNDVRQNLKTSVNPKHRLFRLSSGVGRASGYSLVIVLRLGQLGDVHSSGCFVLKISKKLMSHFYRLVAPVNCSSKCFLYFAV